MMRTYWFHWRGTRPGTGHQYQDQFNNYYILGWSKLLSFHQWPCLALSRQIANKSELTQTAARWRGGGMIVSF